MIRILIALDGSRAAEAAISHAVAIARTFSSQIELLRVISGPPDGAAAPLDRVDWQLRRREAQIYLSRIAESLRKRKLKVSWELREGDAAMEIIQRVREIEADLLVVTRYGRGMAQQFISGGTVHKVMSASTASVLLVDPTDRFDETRGYERVLVPVDGTQRSEWATGFATMVAKANRGSLHLLRVIEVPQWPEGIEMTDESGRYLTHLERTSRTQANVYLRDLSARIDPVVDVTSSLQGSSNVAIAIEDAARDIGADLVVVAADGVPLWRGARSGICENLICRARRPILVLHTQAADSSTRHFRSVFLDEAESFADAV